MGDVMPPCLRGLLSSIIFFSVVIGFSVWILCFLGLYVWGL